MEFLQIQFSVSGVETLIIIPPLVAFMISFFTSMGGISGAFLLLPFQVSILGFAAPAVSATNFFYNVVGTPGGVLRYVRERRMVWPLAGTIISGTLPGVLIGYYCRVKYFLDPKMFKMFVGIVLFVVGTRLLRSLFYPKADNSHPESADFAIRRLVYNVRTVTYEFKGTTASFKIPTVFCFSLMVGIVGGIYGIGGGVLIAPFCVSVLPLPVFTIAGAVLAANFMTSLAGIAFYSTIPLFNGLTAPPDFWLGGLFGLGGILGMYMGAKAQKHVPAKLIKAILTAVVFTIAAKYIHQFF